MSTATELFRRAMSDAGLKYTGEIYADGKLRRFKVDGDHARNSWYVLHDGTPAAGAYGCWKRGIKETWCERNGNLSQSETQRVRQRLQDAESKLKAEILVRQKKARRTAAWIYERARPVHSHAYLKAKGVQSFGELRESYRSELLLPLRDINGGLHSLQFIAPDNRYEGERNKTFLAGGRVSGCFFTLADKADGPLVICEGYATGASIHEATGHSVICAMNSGNLLEVAKAARGLWPQREIIIAADNDQFTDGNPGVTKATAAAKAIRAKLAVPQFKDTATKLTDFNDLAIAEGLDAIRERINAARLAALSPADYESLGKADDQSADLTSLSSLGAVNYPAPLEEAAYYGLAGDIVRRILPETEADPVALLVQFLVGFGNIVGRTSYVIADAARHYLNMFVVLVGETAKGRKGTAWQHVMSFLHAVDEAWCKNIASGLSSGEGLIWAVRDPTYKRLKNKKTGEYEDEIDDAGIEDKRLLVIEGEFASVLKVMTREGNTLSPVMRSAWETGNLRTLTKNSPARATDAHISIIGHITRSEARRELTETESANGFGNRICWAAVRRSKCLPEGGQAVGIADLVRRLKKAIEFAKTAGELKRDDAARKLWARVYPTLSEGKPGLLGAIIARAEAQVTRYSETYALLDCSNEITVDHLKAALALWRYHENSARWIFETGTGDKNADRILAALRVAGKKGLTKWQITNEVFNRHATKFEIDEALRLLHGLDLATCERESTAGRTAERWFSKAQPREVSEESPRIEGQTTDTSHSSHPLPSQIASSADRDPETIEPDFEAANNELLAVADAQRNGADSDSDLVV